MDGILSPGGATATYHQENVLPIGDFVNMDTTPYSWSLAFPTIFPPCYIEMENGLFLVIILVGIQHAT
eukprot:13821083-Ditylum_brightwellii.AAC.1